VAHFHYVMVAGSLFRAFPGTYYWLPKWDRNHVRQEARAHAFLASMIFNLTFFVMHFLGACGNCRRVPDYPLQFADFNMIRQPSAPSASD